MTVNGVSFDVHAGEVLGDRRRAGQRADRTGLRADRAAATCVSGDDHDCWARTSTTPRPAQILERGVAHVPEDRQKHGLVLSFPVHDNLVLCTYYLPPFAKGVDPAGQGHS